MTFPHPQQISLGDFEWIVVSPDSLPEGEDWVLFAITTRDYETMARNQAEILRWIGEAAWRLDRYSEQEAQ